MTTEAIGGDSLLNGVENASTDGSAEAIAAAFPDMTLLAETANHGFAGANNLAARRARGEYLLLLNPDTLVLDGPAMVPGIARLLPGRGGLVHRPQILERHLAAGDRAQLQRLAQADAARAVQPVAHLALAHRRLQALAQLFLRHSLAAHPLS